MRPQTQLTDDELVQLCLDHGIRIDVPYSQLEAEGIWRGVELAVIVRKLLLGKLEEAGVFLRHTLGSLPGSHRGIGSYI